MDKQGPDIHCRVVVGGLVDSPRCQRARANIVLPTLSAKDIADTGLE